jgi:hypothetical protein
MINEARGLWAMPTLLSVLLAFFKLLESTACELLCPFSTWFSDRCFYRIVWFCIVAD